MTTPAPFNTKVARFFDDMKNNKLTATRCTKCKTVFCPPRADCPKCMASNMEWLELSGKGKLVAFTVINVGPESWTKYVPYVVGLIELEEGPKLMAAVRDVKQEEINIGMSVKAVFFENPEGHTYYGFTKA
jgi:uncharacterized protein